MVRQLFPAGEADTFVRHIMRVFDTDGNDFLDFKEFLMAMDISNCQTSKVSIYWVIDGYILNPKAHV